MEYGKNVEFCSSGGNSLSIQLLACRAISASAELLFTVSYAFGMRTLGVQLMSRQLTYLLTDD